MAIVKNGKSYWIDYYYLGKRYREKIGGTKKAAEAALHSIKVKMADGTFVPKRDREPPQPKPLAMTFADFTRKEFLPWSETEHSHKHHERLGYALNARLLPALGSLSLQDITVKMIEDFKVQRMRSHYSRGKKAKPVSEATVNRELCAIKIVFRKAVEWGYLASSPAKEVRMFKEKPVPTRLLEEEEVARLLTHAPDRHRGLISCAVYGGLRPSELRHLCWKDIDWKAKQLTIRSTREHHTKNYNSRIVPMNDLLLEAMRKQPRRLDCQYVFPGKGGGIYRDLRSALNRAVAEAGITGRVTMYQLRHAFCSHALMQGIDPRTVQKWMGHKDLKTTLRYAHVSPEHERSAIQRLHFRAERSDMTAEAM